MPGVSYVIMGPDGAPIVAQEAPFNRWSLLSVAAPDGAIHARVSDGVQQPLHVRRGGVWHAWEPPLGPEQQAAYDAALVGASVFITGPGGCGKSEVIRRIVRDLRLKGVTVAVTGSTGVAAVGLGGCTLHSFLGSGHHATIQALAADISEKRLKSARDRIPCTDVIVVDEVSMLHGDYIDMMHWWLCFVCGLQADDAPMAGKQVIFVGDFLQLPPVILDGERIVHKYAFQSPAWARLAPVTSMLLTNYRQSDDAEFRRHLFRIRKGAAPDDTLDYFNARVGAALPGNGEPTRLCAVNRQVDTINLTRLSGLKGRARTYKATYAGHPGFQEALKRSLPCEDELELKVGAEVMCTVNNMEGGYVNGTRGVVRDMDARCVRVESSAGVMLNVERHTWEMNNIHQELLASVTQFPLRLAWALTIHKSQGSTLDAMVLDPSCIFERAQAYVALSRVRSLAGLSLSSPLRANHVRASKLVVDWYRSQVPWKG